jgi:hypothetical protein
MVESLDDFAIMAEEARTTTGQSRSANTLTLLILCCGEVLNERPCDNFYVEIC